MTTAEYAITLLRERNKLQTKYNSVLALLSAYQQNPGTLNAEYVVTTLVAEHLQHKN